MAHPRKIKYDNGGYVEKAKAKPVPMPIIPGNKSAIPMPMMPGDKSAMPMPSPPSEGNIGEITSKAYDESLQGLIEGHKTRIFHDNIKKAVDNAMNSENTGNSIMDRLILEDDFNNSQDTTRQSDVLPNVIEKINLETESKQENPVDFMMKHIKGGTFDKDKQKHAGQLESKYLSKLLNFALPDTKLLMKQAKDFGQATTDIGRGAKGIGADMLEGLISLGGQAKSFIQNKMPGRGDVQQTPGPNVRETPEFKDAIERFIQQFGLEHYEANREEIDTNILRQLHQAPKN